MWACAAAASPTMDLGIHILHKCTPAAGPNVASMLNADNQVARPPWTAGLISPDAL